MNPKTEGLPAGVLKNILPKYNTTTKKSAKKEPRRRFLMERALYFKEIPTINLKSVLNYMFNRLRNVQNPKPVVTREWFVVDGLFDIGFWLLVLLGLAKLFMFVFQRDPLNSYLFPVGMCVGLLCIILSFFGRRKHVRYPIPDHSAVWKRKSIDLSNHYSIPDEVIDHITCIKSALPKSEFFTYELNGECFLEIMHTYERRINGSTLTIYENKFVDYWMIKC